MFNDDSDRLARIELVDMARRLLNAVAVTDVSAADMELATKDMADLEGRLAQLTRRRIPRASLPNGPLTGQMPYSADPASGYLNPVALPLRLDASEPGRVEGVVTVGSVFEGPIELVHGGYTALLLDGVLGSAVRSAGIHAMTGTLTLKYHAPTPLDTPLWVTGWISETHERKVVAHGSIRTADTLCVSAEGIFVKPRAEVVTEITRN